MRTQADVVVNNLAHVKSKCFLHEPRFYDGTNCNGHEGASVWCHVRPHNKITLMGMTSYQQRYMEMEGAHLHTTGHHDHPVGMRVQ